MNETKNEENNACWCHNKGSGVVLSNTRLLFPENTSEPFKKKIKSCHLDILDWFSAKLKFGRIFDFLAFNIIFGIFPWTKLKKKWEKIIVSSVTSTAMCCIISGWNVNVNPSYMFCDKEVPLSIWMTITNFSRKLPFFWGPRTPPYYVEPIINNYNIRLKCQGKSKPYFVKVIYYD